MGDFLKYVSFILDSVFDMKERERHTHNNGKASKKSSDTYLKALMEVKRCKKNRVNFVLQQQQQNALGTESFASLIATLETRASAKKKCSGPNSGAQTK